MLFRSMDSMANLKKAESHMADFILKNPTGTPFSILHSTTEDFGAGGLGLEMYMVYLKQMTILFGVLAVITIPPLIINYMGGCLREYGITSVLEASTLANIKNIPTNIEELETKMN